MYWFLIIMKKSRNEWNSFEEKQKKIVDINFYSSFFQHLIWIFFQFCFSYIRLISKKISAYKFLSAEFPWNFFGNPIHENVAWYFVFGEKTFMQKFTTIIFESFSNFVIIFFPTKTHLSIVNIDRKKKENHYQFQIKSNFLYRTTRIW